jgi:DNA-binding NarL/FixJ family response regulator/pimeloyl-ACP methyl ester carboxylesterase
MNKSLFSCLIYRIIGKPDQWHDDYLDVMNQVMDETDSFDDPYTFDEMAVGEQIISRLKQGNEASNAFNTLLNGSRFKTIILDDQLKFVYHNKVAEELSDYLQNPENPQKIRPGLAKLIHKSPEASLKNEQNVLIALKFNDQDNEQIYLRSIQSQVDNNLQPTLFHFLLVLDKSGHQQLCGDLITQYQLTDSEQKIILHLIHGKTIKEIAASSFVSKNTVKTHLKSIFRKTDCASQSNVVSLILTHESQILDSYFEADMTTTGVFSSGSNDREMTLSGGEKIAYCDYGPVDGRPLILLHSGFGCRLSVPPNYREICERLNRRIIIPDRPGVGNTPFITGHPNGWNQRLQEFIDLLDINTYDLMGSIFGCKLAVSFAAQADSRLQRLILNSPILINEPNHTEYLTGIIHAAARLVRTSPRFAREIYALWLKSVTLNLGIHYQSMLESSIGSAEKEQFERDGTSALLIDVFKAAASQSLEGISHEMVFTLTPLGLDLSQFTHHVEFWYGTEDKRISLAGIKTIVEDFPSHQLHIREGYSEHIYYALLEEMIA